MTSRQTLRIVSYNIHQGMSGIRKDDAMDRIYDIMVMTRGDIFCIQEDFILSDQEISALYQHAQSAYTHHVFSPTCKIGKGNQGNTIISRFPFQSLERVSFAPSKLQARGFTSTDLVINNQTIKIVCTHLDLSRNQRRRQAGELVDHISRFSGPVILAGDFNDWRHDLDEIFLSSALKDVYFSIHKQKAKSFPAFWPLFPLDRVYARKLECTYASLMDGRARLGHSDHLPLICDFLV